MAININWQNSEKTIVLWEFVAPWTWVEFYDAIAEQKKLMSSDQQTIDFIADFSNAYPLPEQILVHAFYAAYQLNTHADGSRHDTYIVLIQPGSFLSSLGSIILNRFPQFTHGLRLGSSREDALNLLHHLRNDEPEIKVMRWHNTNINAPLADSMSL
ncbi:MAG: hypothetical protein RLP44_06650 [Aggregatilineales bacterium]